MPSVRFGSFFVGGFVVPENRPFPCGHGFGGALLHCRVRDLHQACGPHRSRTMWSGGRFVCMFFLCMLGEIALSLGISWWQEKTIRSWLPKHGSLHYYACLVSGLPRDATEPEELVRHAKAHAPEVRGASPGYDVLKCYEDLEATVGAWWLQCERAHMEGACQSPIMVESFSDFQSQPRQVLQQGCSRT